jgi:uncharacterized membrane protein YdjX (TVP38/TMEM64 family)
MALRVALVLALPVVLLVVGHATGLHQRLSVDGVRAAMHAAGVWGGALFVASFCVGELVHVPGLVFVAVSVLAYGPKLGGAAAYLAALVSLSVSFWVVRSIGGRPLTFVRRPFVQRWLAKLGERPVRTIALLRLVFILSPPLNYALALSGVRFRQYLAGSALGLLAPTALAVAFFDRVVEWAR